MHVNERPGSGRITVLLVWGSQFTDQIFRDFQSRGNKSKVWDGLEITPPKSQMRIVQGLELQVPANVA